jgi:hypothetical protein
MTYDNRPMGDVMDDVMMELSLYILSVLRITAYYCVFYFVPFRPSNSNFGNIEEWSSQQVTHLPPLGIFCLP